MSSLKIEEAPIPVMKARQAVCEAVRECLDEYIPEYADVDDLVYQGKRAPAGIHAPGAAVVVITNGAIPNYLAHISIALIDAWGHVEEYLAELGFHMRHQPIGAEAVAFYYAPEVF